ncbi:hypothetical protein [Paraburkholderia sp. SOS3]|jgi:hypothetical protein|uniref:hypothetical protein n=1 Tax=Paraburkholderia sp. SOS3 TaxID=1926494 RepID=UPI0009476534|nr:hypothetical protein [Paraburkholderia sp. SOS3]APR39671.1 hypothetical protein BTO02_31185 [Paraburkholderia sp. SOS3]
MNPVATVAVTTVAVASNLSYAQPAAPPEVPASTASGLKYVEAASPSTTQSVPSNTSEEVSQMISRPKTPVEFVRNLKFIFDHDLLLNDDFYSEANLKNVFSLESAHVTRTVEQNGDGRISISSSHFLSIFPWVAIPGRVELTPTAQLVGGKAVHHTGRVTAGMNFLMHEGGPDFDESQRVFAETFTRLPPQPSPHGGPPPATAPHGNETWQYKQLADYAEKTLTIGFDPTGRLSSVLIGVKKN